MNDSKISVRYAKALFLTAKEDKNLENVVRNIKLIRASLDVARFSQFLESPVIKTSDKRKLVKEVFEKNVEGLTFNFLELLLINKREIYLVGIIRNFISFYREDQDIKEATLSIPFTVSDEYQNKFIKILEDTLKAKIDMEEVINPELIGGFILKVEDQQFDASVKTQLSRIKKKLLETSIENN